LVLTPDLVGPSVTRNSGIIGEGVDLDLKHLGDMRSSTLLFHLTQRLLYTKFRDPGEEPKLHLFGQLKRVTKQWLDKPCLICKGGTYPALLMYQELADMACNRITAGITRKFIGEIPIKALLDPYNPTGSTKHVRFNTSKTDRWQTSPDRCHINWIILDSDWEAEFCRVAESHPQVKAYVKNYNLGLEGPYRYGSEMRMYRPDFIVLLDDGHPPLPDGRPDWLHLIVEIKGYRREDAKEKKSTMETYWVPGVNNVKTYGRWAFAELTEIYQIEADFRARIEAEFARMIDAAIRQHEPLNISGAEAGKREIARHFGADDKWIRLNDAIWNLIESRRDHRLFLSDLDEIAESTSTDTDDALALLGLLSRPSVQLLRVEFRDEFPEPSVLESSEVMTKLAAWWKDRTITQGEWQDWAEKVSVAWHPPRGRAVPG
jgi:hypothetical protein